ncbi:MAG: hypothetical protein AAF628_36685 [Planctomycetota bacterium]
MIGSNRARIRRARAALQHYLRPPYPKNQEALDNATVALLIDLRHLCGGAQFEHLDVAAWRHYLDETESGGRT